jgi:hypothetical protein
MMRRRRRRLAPFVVATALVLGGCGGGGDDAMPTIGPTETSEPAPATETAAPDPVIGEIVWTTAVDATTNEPVEPVTRFPQDSPVIIATVDVEHIPQGAVLSASWTYNGAPLQGVAQSVMPSQPYPGGFVEFHLTRSEGQNWPTGEYAVTISLDGAAQQSSSVDVVSS